MTAPRHHRPRPVWLAAALCMLAGCAPQRFQMPDHEPFLLPADGRLDAVDGRGGGPGEGERDGDQEIEQAPPPAGPLQLETVLQSVVERYPPFLAKLLERDLASGRLQQAMGGFDAYASAKVGGRLQGFYESTVAQAMLEQPLATGDSIYGGYRISDRFLPDYYRDRTQDDGEFVFGGRFPLLQNRSIDGRRADVRVAEIGVMLAEPEIRAARIEYVRLATIAYEKWRAYGIKLEIARELLRLAMDRRDGLQRAVERQFLAPIAVTDNEQLIAKREVYVTQADREFRAAALKLSLYLRDGDDRPIVATEQNLPDAAERPLPEPPGPAERDLRTAAENRPELRALQLELERTATERDLAENRTLPQLDVVVEAASSLSDGPYKDREDLELVVGGELKLPLQRRKAFGKLQQAEAKLNKLRIEQGWLRDRITNELLDVRVAMQAARDQLDQARRLVDAAQQLVQAEQRAFDLGRSDLLRVQLREAQLADARTLQVESRLRFDIARAAYRAVLGYAADP